MFYKRHRDKNAASVNRGGCRAGKYNRAAVAAKKYFEEYNLRIKLIITNICFALIPILIISVFSYVTFYKNFKNLLYDSIDMLFSQVSGRISDYSNNISTYTNIFMEDDFQLELIEYNEKPTNELYQNLKEELQHIKTFSDSIREVYLITKDGVEVSSEERYIPSDVSEYIDKLRESNAGDGRVIYDTGFKSDSVENAYITFQTIKGVKYNHLEVLGYGVIVLDRNFLNRLLDSDGLLENSHTVVTNEEFDIITLKHKIGEEQEFDYSGITDKGVLNIDGVKYLSRIKNVDRVNWKIVTIVPASEITRKMDPIIFSILLIIFIVIALIGILLGIVSVNIVKPIQILTEAFRAVADGNLKYRIHFDRKSELTVVEKGFNTMTRDIKTLTSKMLATQERLYEAELEKNRLEIDMLFSQINSHFLFNTLSVIRGMAAENRTTEVGATLKNLVFMLRYITRKTKFVTLKEEIDYLLVYMKIQNVRHNDIFNINLHLSEEAENAVILKLLIQPIVENAIAHGFVNKRESCLLSVSAYVEDNSLCICVEDNGDGMEPERLEWVNRQLDNWEDFINHEEEIRSIGTVNIQRRIKLFYGEDYGMKVESEKDGFSRFILRLPYIDEEKSGGKNV